ncbi:acyl carrier protein [Bacillota bacterium Meth-B3]|nr:phosphopantetheine-binding protein [Christensenellaceae bacterium]MEA5069352.1 phosphopantetheine-binding protein [Christensenellaceae bacterium]
MSDQAIRRMLAEIQGVDEELIGPTTRLWRAVDAISLAQLIVGCERRFRITIDDERVCEFARVKDLSDYVDRRVADGQDDYAPPSEEARAAWYYE